MIRRATAVRKNSSTEIGKRVSGVLVLTMAAAAMGLLMPAKGEAATYTWGGAAGDGVWSSTGNWTPVQTFVSGDTLRFGTATGATTQLTDDITVGFTSIIFSGASDLEGASAPFAISAGGAATALNVTGTITDHSANGNAITFNLPVAAVAFAFGGAGNSAAVFNNGGTFSGALTSTTNGSTADVLTVGAGATVTFNGSSTIGAVAGTTNSNTSLSVMGAANSTLTFNSTLNIGTSNNTGSGTSNNETVNLTGVGNFNLATATGSLNIGTGNQTNATLLLSNGNNTIGAASVNVGNFSGGKGIYADLMELGAGNNTIQAGNLTIGRGVSGSVHFAGAAGQVTIQGTNGGAANVTVGVGEANSTTQSLTSSLLLAGHVATLNLNTLVIAQNDFSAFNGPTNSGAVTFDAGTMAVGTIQMSRVTSSRGKTNASLTIGGGAVGVSTAFDLIDNAGDNGNAQASVLNLNGGTVTVGASIDEIISGSNASIAANGTINFNGGTLDMTGHVIGVGGVTGSGFRGNVDHVNMPGAGHVFTLVNLGRSSAVAGGSVVADGINGAGVTMDGAGTLILGGENTYAGGTLITAGTVVVASVGGLGSGGVSIHTGGVLRLQSGLGGAVQVPSLTFDGSTGKWGGVLDLANNKLIVEARVSHGGALADLESASASAIISAGLASNYGVAVLDNAVLNWSKFGGVGVDGDSILVGPELWGDANADGSVDMADLTTVLNNFGSSTAAWTSGNFDGGSTIDLTDLADVINHFGASNPNTSAGESVFRSGSTAAPEPASLAVVGWGAVGLLARRRKG